MSLPTADDYEAGYWLNHEEYYSLIDGTIVFNDDAPQRVIDSYQLWKSRA